MVSHYDVIFFQFRSTLSRALVEALNTFDLVNSDTRIGPLIKVRLSPQDTSTYISSDKTFCNVCICEEHEQAVYRQRLQPIEILGQTHSR